MTELTHDAEDGFHEIQLSGKQLVFLFMATTVVSVVIFLCGVLVGRGVRAERGEDPTVASAQTPSVPAGTGPVATEPPSPAPEQPLSYDDRLRGDKTPPEKLSKGADTPATQPVAQESAPQSPPAQTAAQPVPSQAAASPSPAGGDVSAGPQPGSWVIQVHALQNREAANKFVRSLTSKGYPAFLLAPEANAPQIFRVQIGGYRDRSEAEKVASRLEKEEQFRPAIKRR